jgi:hypothetical protein
MPLHRKIAPATVAKLQTALDLADLRVKELETICEALNERLAESNDRADAAELVLWQSRMLDEAGQVALNENATRRPRRATPARRHAH